MTEGAGLPPRCGIDTVAIARIERLLRETPEEDLRNLFSPAELGDSGEGPGRAASLAARFAAKEACLKLFPREATLGLLGPADFSVVRDGYGAPRVECSPAAHDVLGRHRVRSIALSLSHDRTTASAVAMIEPAGFVKILAHAETDRILGMHLVGANVSELVHEGVLTMEFSGSADDLARICHAHPSLSEVVHDAAMAVSKRAIHKAN